MTEQVDLDALEALAKAATPGPWVMTTQGGIEPHGYAGPGEDANSVAQVRHGRNWGFIAAADPSTILALIAELRQERERADGHAEQVENQAHNLSVTLAALSRAEETISKVRESIRVELGADLLRYSGAWRLLTEYGKQKGADRD